MSATIDRDGRIVVPKELREELGLRPGQVLKIRANEGRLELEASPAPVRVRRSGRHAAIVLEDALRTLTVDQLRETLERIRR